MSIESRLEKLAKAPPHCLLFEGTGAMGEHAEKFARTLLNTTKKDPPDLRELYPEGKGLMHPMHAIKQMIEETTFPPFESERKVFIIHDAEKMLPSSSNALLKTLEEPASEVTFILISSHPEALLPTITSRCFRLYFNSMESGEKGEEEPLAEQMFHVGLRLLRRDLPTSKEFPPVEDLSTCLSYLFYFFRDLHLLRSGAPSSLLFFKKKREVLSKIEGPIPLLEAVQRKIDRALDAARRHLSLGSILPSFLP
ncbi:MAG: hypothetical protein KDK60_02530 [Chlamydiia bacterium]|nr:hypothetical protein [Chlamydiia bacterium]